MGRAEVWPQTVLTPAGLSTLWRVVESGTSRPVDCWLPGFENPDPEGDLDRGGFDSKADADAFRLGVDWIRAEAGLIPESTAQIDRERRKLDQWSKSETPQPFAGATFQARLSPLSEPDDPTYRETPGSLSEAPRGVSGALAF